MTKLDLLKTNAALHALMGLGLAKQDRTTAWHVTARGKACVFETVPDRQRRNSSVPSPGARRLLEVLKRPWGGHDRQNRGRDMADEFTSLRSGCMHKGM